MTSKPLLDLLRLLKERDYDFTAVTPATHSRVIARRCERPTLRDIFGWNRSFGRDQLAPELLQCLEDADALDAVDGRLFSKVRVASLDGDLFLHSAFPTTAPDAVFFGPDTYRFVRLIAGHLARENSTPAWIVDMGGGTGAGAIAAARGVPSARITCVDVNPRALDLAAINVRAAGLGVELVRSSQLPVGPDLVIANPPYMMDSERRAYRDGGDLLGGQVAFGWARDALASMSRAGTTLLYTGASVVNGRAPLVDALGELCRSVSAHLEIEEVDPDVFGEELDQAAYREVERIAVICATIRKA